MSAFFFDAGQSDKLLTTAARQNVAAETCPLNFAGFLMEKSMSFFSRLFGKPSATEIHSDAQESVVLDQASVVAESDSRTGGFVAGTLVHTKAGLVPIQNIRVGDLLLSQPEGTGELAYKPVTKTFVNQDKQVGLIECIRFGNGREDHAAKMNSIAEGDALTMYEETSNPLVVTEGHPFFVKGIGWTRAVELDPGDSPELLLMGDSLALGYYLELRNTEVEGVALAMNQHYFDEVGTRVDLRKNAPEISDEPVENRYASSLEGGFCTQSVYNLEVDGFHTFYVGESGVWVHDSVEANPDLTQQGRAQ